MLSPKVHLCHEPLPPLSKKVGLICLKGAFYFSYSGHKCNCWFKIVDHWNKRENGVMCTRKEIKSGLKSVRMETDIATHTCKLFLRKKPEHWDINIVLL